MNLTSQVSLSRGCLRILLTFVLTIYTGWLSASAWAVDARYSGSWYDPAKDGQGFVLQVLNANSALITWFTFDTEGQQAWMQAVGHIDGQRMVFDELLRFTGPRFGNDSYDPSDRQTIASGRLEIEFDGCHRGQARYKGAGGFPDDTLTLTRLTSVVGFGCDVPAKAQHFPLHHGISGAWYAPAQDGQGWMVEVLSEHEALVYWFTYDRNGQQRWMLGVGPIRNERIEVQDLRWAEGGRFGADFDPADVITKSWGQVNLKLWPCRGAAVDYVEGQSRLDQRGEFSGVVPLASIDGSESCPPYVDKWTAARLLDQAAFGPTPFDEHHVYQLGIEGWIDEQFTVPPSHIEWEDLSCYSNFFDLDSGMMKRTEYPYWSAVSIRMLDQMVGAPDQLRLRLSWALSQLLVISSFSSDISTLSTGVYFNMLQDTGLTNFRDLLRAVTLSPAMGRMLDNAGSKAASEHCPDCLPNENYARELLMLFTIGVDQLNMDGSIKRDEAGKPIEAFTQRDVMEVARALSGWAFSSTSWDHVGVDCPGGERGLAWYTKPLVLGNPADHDRQSKLILGHEVPANQGIHGDLESVLDILMSHPNIAPFVSFRLIQHFTTSNPSPDYVRRVANVFSDNGSGVAGDMQAVMRAILLDPEARQGDDPARLQPNFGRLRDMVHHRAAVARGMECKKYPSRVYWGSEDEPGYGMRYIPPLPRNDPFMAPDVFSFYPPNNQVPGMDLLSPEHMLLNFSGIEARVFWAVPHDEREFEHCNFDKWAEAIQAGPNALLKLVRDRYMRGIDEFHHEAAMHRAAGHLGGWYRNRAESDDPNSRTALFQFSNFLGYTLLGEEFGVLR